MTQRSEAIALALLTGAGAIASRAVLAASVGWLAVVGAVYASDAGPPLPAMAFTAAVLFPVAAWAAAAQLAATSRTVRQVLTPSIGAAAVLVGEAVPAVLWTAVASVVGVVAAVLLDPARVTPGEAAVGLVLHLCAGATGVALAFALDARRVRAGTRAGVVLALFLLSVVVPVVPPSGPALAAWSRYPAGGQPVARLWSFAGALLAVGVLVALTVRWRRRVV